MALKRAIIFVSGNVERVGYRGKVINAGRHLNLLGYVENKPDGRVQIVAEGEEDNLNKFLDAVNIKNVLINVEHIYHSFVDAVGEFSGFNKLVGGVKQMSALILPLTC
ncbi:MAG: acylphosphatase [Candidatus Argoarchaeum ethanivorans]|uniref:acylphosphatase n=1 Tax=Candidatus Argoarchaeum ethanivorans TaxID=2608793 RepID=A0A8B6SDD9_9EURY|nr:MAG: acylphosphatase [Candidatus Argoarchaeum ethanivorans]